MFFPIQENIWIHGFLPETVGPAIHKHLESNLK